MERPVLAAPFFPDNSRRILNFFERHQGVGAGRTHSADGFAKAIPADPAGLFPHGVSIFVLQPSPEKSEFHPARRP